jgi:hypothetical protein
VRRLRRTCPKDLITDARHREIYYPCDGAGAGRAAAAERAGSGRSGGGAGGGVRRSRTRRSFDLAVGDWPAWKVLAGPAGKLPRECAGDLRRGSKAAIVLQKHELAKRRKDQRVQQAGHEGQAGNIAGCANNPPRTPNRKLGMHDLHAALLALQELDDEIARKARVQEFTPQFESLEAPVSAAPGAGNTPAKLEELRSEGTALEGNAQQKQERLRGGAGADEQGPQRPGGSSGEERDGPGPQAHWRRTRRPAGVSRKRRART